MKKVLKYVVVLDDQTGTVYAYTEDSAALGAKLITDPAPASLRSVAAAFGQVAKDAGYIAAGFAGMVEEYENMLLILQENAG